MANEQDRNQQNQQDNTQRQAPNQQQKQGGQPNNDTDTGSKTGEESQSIKDGGMGREGDSTSKGDREGEAE